MEPEGRYRKRPQRTERSQLWRPTMNRMRIRLTKPKRRRARRGRGRGYVSNRT